MVGCYFTGIQNEVLMRKIFAPGAVIDRNASPTPTRVPSTLGPRPILLPHHVERAAGAPLPAQHHVAAERERIEIAIAQRERRSADVHDLAAVGIDREDAAAGAVLQPLAAAGLEQLAVVVVTARRRERLRVDIEVHVGLERQPEPDIPSTSCCDR